MDDTEQWQARAELEEAFEEIKRLKDRLHDENLALREQIDQAFMFEEIVGSSPPLQAVLSTIVRVAPTDSTVLTETLQNREREIIEAALAESKGKVAGPKGAAGKLGIPPSTLDWKIKQLRINIHKFSSES